MDKNRETGEEMTSEELLEVIDEAYKAFSKMTQMFIEALAQTLSPLWSKINEAVELLSQFKPEEISSIFNKKEQRGINYPVTRNLRKNQNMKELRACRICVKYRRMKIPK